MDNIGLYLFAISVIGAIAVIMVSCEVSSLNRRLKHALEGSEARRENVNDRLNRNTRLIDKLASAVGKEWIERSGYESNTLG